ncbi:MAG TPA: hypothetical protein VD971_04450 [Phycisphaerales bacterium]|nr:hypothetical protein [Phycisphaerales bacterium]
MRRHLPHPLWLLAYAVSAGAAAWVWREFVEDVILTPVPVLVVVASIAAVGAYGTHAGLAITWRAWRRHFARVNGLCSRCGYERATLADDAPCPECGARA